MSSSTVQTPPYPIALLPAHITPTSTTLHIKQNDQTYEGLDYTVNSALNSSLLFTVSGPRGADMSKPREFRDATGLPLFLMRRRWYTSENAWFLELPGGGGGEDMIETKLKFSWTKGKVDLRLTNAAVGLPQLSGGNEKKGVVGVHSEKKLPEEEVVLEIRIQNKSQTLTFVNLGGIKIVEIRRTLEGNLMHRGAGHRKGLRMEWEADVAEGFDLSLVAIIVVIISDMHPSAFLTSS